MTQVLTRASWPFLVILLTLSGCTTQQMMTSPKLDGAPLQQQLSDINNWHIKGKLGLRTDRDSGSLYVNWQQMDRDFDIHLNGALGQGATHIYGNDDLVALERGNRPIITATTPEQLLYENSGWYIPVSHLYFWVRGIPTPEAPIDSSEYNQYGLLETLHQGGWHINYSRHGQVDEVTLPTKMTVQRGELKLTLIIKDWQLL